LIPASSRSSKHFFRSLGCSFCHAMITFFGSSAYVIINGCPFRARDVPSKDL
jgi:hypothetical protein